MLYLAWDREVNISQLFCDVFVWKWGPRPRTSSGCYHGNKSVASFKKAIFLHPPWVPNCMQNLKGGWKCSFPKMFDSYRDLFLKSRLFFNLPNRGMAGTTDKCRAYRVKLIVKITWLCLKVMVKITVAVEVAKGMITVMWTALQHQLTF